jgi:hypothetical protein
VRSDFKKSPKNVRSKLRFIKSTLQVEVLGVDLSTNMLAIANEHKSAMEPEVQVRRLKFRTHVYLPTYMNYPRVMCRVTR